MRFFNIYRHGKNVIVEEVTEAVKKESEIPEKLLVYSTMYQNETK